MVKVADEAELLDLQRSRGGGRRRHARKRRVTARRDAAVDVPAEKRAERTTRERAGDPRPSASALRGRRPQNVMDAPAGRTKRARFFSRKSRSSARSPDGGRRGPHLHRHDAAPLSGSGRSTPRSRRRRRRKRSSRSRRAPAGRSWRRRWRTRASPRRRGPAVGAEGRGRGPRRRPTSRRTTADAIRRRRRRRAQFRRRALVSAPSSRAPRERDRGR